MAETALVSLQECDKDIRVYPKLHKLLIVLTILPLSTASSEKSFSTRKQVKTYLRNRTGDDRLVGLGLMTVHHISSTLISIMLLMNLTERIEIKILF